MGKYQDFLNGTDFPSEKEIGYYEDIHGSFNEGQTVSGAPFGLSGSVLCYEPHTPEEVEMIIDALRKHQLAIVQLTNESPQKAQRILDMLAGAVYALCGSMAVVNREQNVYLLTPEGIPIAVPTKD